MASSVLCSLFPQKEELTSGSKPSQVRRFFGAYLLAGILLLLPICYSDKAATLSHGASFLVLERGGSPYGNPNIINIENFAPTLLDTSPTSPGQHFTSEDRVFNICTRVLGGGSVLNARFYKRASTHYIREVGWNQGMVDQSYEWVEKVVAFEPEILQWESAFRDGLY
ncbi:protein HOTHEAD-like [Malus domestica]|uniref:protein HOTHEAD-like n=1 Tax=Malus domestica TaxID=3750 RepID=UPI003975E005